MAERAGVARHSTERRQCSWWGHEQLSVAAARVAARPVLWCCGGSGDEAGGSEGEVHEEHGAPGDRSHLSRGRGRHRAAG